MLARFDFKHKTNGEKQTIYANDSNLHTIKRSMEANDFALVGVLYV